MNANRRARVETVARELGMTTVELARLLGVRPNAIIRVGPAVRRVVAHRAAHPGDVTR